MNSNFGLVQVICLSLSLEFNGPVASYTSECKSLKSSPNVHAPANAITPATLTDRVVKFAHLDGGC